jgi:hypothetical protein
MVYLIGGADWHRGVRAEGWGPTLPSPQMDPKALDPKVLDPKALVRERLVQGVPAGG